MTVRADLFSRLREIAGSPSLEIVLTEGAVVEDLFRELCLRYPRLSDFERSVLFGRGLEFIDRHSPLAEGDEIAIMPPVQGG